MTPKTFYLAELKQVVADRCLNPQLCGGLQALLGGKKSLPSTPALLERERDPRVLGISGRGVHRQQPTQRQRQPQRTDALHVLPWAPLLSFMLTRKSRKLSLDPQPRFSRSNPVSTTLRPRVQTPGLASGGPSVAVSGKKQAKPCRVSSVTSAPRGDNTRCLIVLQLRRMLQNHRAGVQTLMGLERLNSLVRFYGIFAATAQLTGRPGGHRGVTHSSAAEFQVLTELLYRGEADTTTPRAQEVTWKDPLKMAQGATE
jgi:hypothetical protein